MDRNIIPEKFRLKISHELKKRNVTKCPMCGESKFVVADTYTVNNLYSDIDDVGSSARTLPCALMICANCGYISQHALGALGLMQEAKDVTANGK